MNEQDLFRGIGEVNDEQIERARPQAARRRRWPGLLAACLVLALGVGAALRYLPGRTGNDTARPETAPQNQTQLGSGKTNGGAQGQTQDSLSLAQLAAVQAEYPAYPQLPANGEPAGHDYYDQVDALRGEDPDPAYLGGLQRFSMNAVQQLLADAGTENRICSPANVYMGLALLAEAAAGGTRSQLLDVLGTDSIETVRAQTQRIWLNLYRDNGQDMIRLANSLWLAEGESWNSEALDEIRDNYYASVYSGPMGTAQYNAAMNDWLAEQTNGLLQDEAAPVETDASTVLAILSTLYFHEPWEESFDAARTAPDAFTMADGTELTCDYLHDDRGTDYILGEGWRAATVPFAPSWTGAADQKMLFLLPDEGVSVDALLEGGAVEQALQTLALGAEQKTVELQIPKFSVSCDLDLVPALQALGVTEAFGADADFSSLLANAEGARLTTARQAALVRIDEEGCEAASFVELCVERAAEMIPEEPPRLILNRPFIFVITGLDGLPLYVGVVNNPNQAA